MAYFLKLPGPNGQHEPFVMYVHVPKTGGCWLERFFSGLENTEGKASTEGSSAPQDCDVRHFRAEDIRWDGEVIGSVRSPITWYESWWRHQTGSPITYAAIKKTPRWHPLRCVLSCYDTDFNRYVRNCLETQPAFVTRLYEWFLGPPGRDVCSTVFRQETLRFQAIQFVTARGYDGPIPHVERVNQSKRIPLTWDAGLKRDLERMEEAAFRRWYG